MSIREISKENFSDGTTIDGDRLDHVLQNAVDYVNLVPVKSMPNSFCMKQIVVGYTPRQMNYMPISGSSIRPRELPWCRMSLDTNVISTTNTRMKGTDPAGIFPRNIFSGDGYVWTVPFRTSNPVTVVDIQVDLQTDEDETYFPNDWRWTSNGPGTIASGDFVEDVFINLQFASYVNDANSNEDDVIFAKKEFSLDASAFNSRSGWSSSMVPDDFTLRKNGVSITSQNLNVPIPANSSVRMLIFLPDYVDVKSSTNAALTSGSVRWLRNNPSGSVARHESYSFQGYSACISYIERIK